MKNKTTFQAILDDAQPSMSDRIQNVVYVASVCVISSVVTGIDATVEVTVQLIDNWVKIVDKVYDLTH